MGQKKLSADDITTMHFSNKVQDDSQAQLAVRYDVSQATVSRYVSQIEQEIEAMQLHGRDYYDARMEAYESFKHTY